MNACRCVGRSCFLASQHHCRSNRSGSGAADRALRRKSEAAAQSAGKPNILVIYGDDIGITNISAYSDGLMGYETPNIDRIGKEGLRFLQYYGEQSCTAGRSAFLTGQHIIRTGLSKVGFPGAPMGMSQLDPSIGGIMKNLGYATGQFGKNHVGDRNETLPTVNGFDEFFGNLYHLNAEEEPELPDYPKDPEYFKKFGPRGVLHTLGDRHRRSDSRSALRQGRQAEDRGYRRAHQEAHGDGRRRNLGGGDRLHEAAARRGQAVLHVVQLNAHAPQDACPPRTPRPLHPRGQRIYRRHDRARRHHRHLAQVARRHGHRRQHHRRLHHRQRTAHEHLAGRSHDSVPVGEEHQLGRRFPRAGNGALARSHQARNGDQRADGASRLDADFASIAGEPDLVNKLKAGYTANGITYKVHLDGYDQSKFLESVSGSAANNNGVKSARDKFFYSNDDGLLVAMRKGDYKYVFSEQRKEGTMGVWAEPFTTLRLQKIFNIMQDPFERADITSNTFWDWQINHVGSMYGVMDDVFAFVTTFKEFPPRSFPPSFNPANILGETLDDLQNAGDAEEEHRPRAHPRRAQQDDRKADAGAGAVVRLQESASKREA